MSDSLQPHGLKPARCLCPGKNTGVGCHFLLQGSSWPTDWTRVSCLAGSFFTTEPPGKPWMRPLLQWYYNCTSPSDESCFPHFLTGVVPKIFPPKLPAYKSPPPFVFLETCPMKEYHFDSRLSPKLKACFKFWPSRWWSEFLWRPYLSPPTDSWILLTIPLADGPIDHLKSVKPPPVSFLKCSFPIGSTIEPLLVTKLVN